MKRAKKHPEMSVNFKCQSLWVTQLLRELMMMLTVGHFEYRNRLMTIRITVIDSVVQPKGIVFQSEDMISNVNRCTRGEGGLRAIVLMSPMYMGINSRALLHVSLEQSKCRVRANGVLCCICLHSEQSVKIGSNVNMKDFSVLIFSLVFNLYFQLQHKLT